MNISARKAAALDELPLAGCNIYNVVIPAATASAMKAAPSAVAEEAEKSGSGAGAAHMSHICPWYLSSSCRICSPRSSGSVTDVRESSFSQRCR